MGSRAGRWSACPRGRPRRVHRPAGARRRRLRPGALVKRGAESRELLLELERHLLVGGGADVSPQRHLEPVAAASIRALVEVRLGLAHLLVAQVAIEIRLHDLFASRAGIERIAAQFTTSSANSVFRIRLARWSLLMTGPIGISRICAASA